MSKKSEVKKVTKETKSEKQEAQEKLAAIEKKEQEDCANKVKATLEEYGCIAIISGKFVNDRIETNISIVKKK